MCWRNQIIQGILGADRRERKHGRERVRERETEAGTKREEERERDLK